MVKSTVLNLLALDKSLDENIDVLRTRDLSKEHVKVEVYNGTDITWMFARIMARKIHNAGCSVIRHENAAKTMKKSYIYVLIKKNSQMVWKL
jgi:hypothetical protein